MTSRDRMEPGRRRERATSFGPAADLYDSVRPTYPAAAVAWALEPLGAGPWRVADLGAGTGIMTRVLASLGHEVTAVEPDERMRARLTAATPGVSAVAGSAEEIPLPDGAADAVVAAQSYHWFDHSRAHPELARVIRPGGVFAAIFNNRDESVPWIAEYSRIVEGDRDRVPDDSGTIRVPSFGDGFGPVELGLFPHEVPHTAESLVALMMSRSYYITASPERRVALEEGIRRLATDHPDLAGRDQFPLPYVTRVFRAVRR